LGGISISWKNKDKEKEYQEYITGKLGQIERKQDVNEEWINIKKYYLRII